MCAAAALVAACDSNYHVSLEVAETVNAGCDTSCIRSVGVEVIGRNSGEFYCITDVSMKSLRDHGLSGRLDLAAPDELKGVWVTGFRGEGCDGNAMVDGIAAVDGSDVKVQMKCVAPCKSAAMIPVQVTSVIAAANGTCSSGAASLVAAGSLRATDIDVVFPGDPYSAVVSNEAPVALVGGAATVNGLVAAGAGKGCSAVAVHDGDGPASIACIRPGVAGPGGSRGLCGADGKTEVAWYDGGLGLDMSGFRTVAVVAQRNAAPAPPTPLADAVVTLDPAATGARVEYLTLDAARTSLIKGTLTKTDASGAFAVFSREPVEVTVTAPGRSAMKRMVGGGFYYTGTTEVTLGGAQLFVYDAAP
jgi:hypothetical protein